MPRDSNHRLYLPNLRNGFVDLRSFFFWRKRGGGVTIFFLLKIVVFRIKATISFSSVGCFTLNASLRIHNQT